VFSEIGREKVQVELPTGESPSKMSYTHNLRPVATLNSSEFWSTVWFLGNKNDVAAHTWKNFWWCVNNTDATFIIVIFYYPR